MSVILLLGASGQVGHELRRSLLALGRIVAPARGTLDLADKDGVRGFVREVRPRLIVNAAAYTAVDAAEGEPELARLINTEAPAILAEEAVRHGALLVHYSTDYVFGGGGDSPFSEHDPTAPLNVYGATKLAGEAAIAAVGGRYLILRTSWVYGARGQNFLGTIRRLASERKTLQVVSDQFGAPTWCRLIADVTAQAVASDEPPESEVLHLAAAGCTSWHGFAERIVERMRERGEHVRTEAIEAVATGDFPAAARRPANSRLSCARLEQRFSLELPDWRECLDLCLEEVA